MREGRPQETHLGGRYTSTGADQRPTEGEEDSRPRDLKYYSMRGLVKLARNRYLRSLRS